MIYSKELTDYLQDLDLEKIPFSPSEINEIILSVYNIFEWVIKDNCDLIEVSPTNIVWKKSRGTAIVGQLKVPKDFNPSFEKILSQDTLINQYIKKGSSKNKMNQYMIYSESTLGRSSKNLDPL